MKVIIRNECVTPGYTYKSNVVLLIPETDIDTLYVNMLETGMISNSAELLTMNQFSKLTAEVAKIKAEKEAIAKADVEIIKAEAAASGEEN